LLNFKLHCPVSFLTYDIRYHSGRAELLSRKAGEDKYFKLNNHRQN